MRPPLNGQRSELLSVGRDGPEARIHGTLARALAAASAGAGLESIDFDPCESERSLQHGVAAGSTLRGGRTVSPSIAFRALRWALVAGTGVATGLTGALIDYFLGLLVSGRFGLLRHLVSAGQPPVILLLAHVASCTALAAVAGVLVCFVEPLAAGSGIPEVKCRLNGVDLPNVIALRTYVAKAVGILFSVASGLPCGKEGPMIHSGAIIGGAFAHLGHWAFPSQYDFVLESRDLITAGAAAGVAAAFGAPLGGVLFAMEEGSSFWNMRTFLPTFVSTAMSALTLNYCLVGFRFGEPLPWGTLGSLGVLTFGASLESDTTTFRMWELPVFLAMGVGGGLLGALFNALNVPLTRFRMRHVGPRGWRRFVEVIVVTVCIATCFFVPPLLERSCYVPDVNTPTGDATAYWMSCDPEGSSKTASVAAGFFVSPSEDTIKVMLHDTNVFDNLGLVVFGSVYFVLACWTYGLGVPSGLFVPSLLVGSTFGRLCGQLLGRSLGRGTTLAGGYALVGAATTLAGMARITISLAVILIEATGDTQWTLPLLFAVTVAKWVGDVFNKGIYDIHINLKRVPLLEAFPEPEMQSMLVSDVMNREVVALEGVMRVRDLLARLEGCKHSGFPVVEPDASGRLLGLLPRASVLRLLLQLPGAATSEGELAVPFAKVAGGPRLAEPSVAEVRAALAPADHGRLIDLRPFANASAFTVPEHMTLRRAYTLFRSMGLRHLPVVDRQGRPCGMITRKDLILEH